MSVVDAGRWLVTGLAGGPLPPPPAVEVPALAARLAENPADDDAREALLALVQHATLPGRLAAALADDDVMVPLADGSAMTHLAAERALAHKEEARVYPPLRGPLLKARRRALDPLTLRDTFDDVARRVGVPSSSSLADDLAFLRAFLAASAPLAAPALEVLERIAGPITDAPTLARALDRPVGEHGSDAAAIQLVRVTREALPRGARPLQRRAAPRALRGHMVDDGEVVRVLWAECRRLGGQRALLSGVGLAYGRLGGVADVAAGIGLLLQNPPTRRAAGASSSMASALWRETVAVALVQARLGAAVAAAFIDADVDPEAPAAEQSAMRRDAVWRAARAAVGVPVAELADDLLVPPWPDGVALRDAASALAAQSRQALLGALDALLLRDVGDEGLMLRSGALGAVRETLAGRPSPVAADAADAWRALLGEVA